MYPTAVGWLHTVRCLPRCTTRLCQCVISDCSLEEPLSRTPSPGSESQEVHQPTRMHPLPTYYKATPNPTEASELELRCNHCSDPVRKAKPDSKCEPSSQRHKPLQACGMPHTNETNMERLQVRLSTPTTQQAPWTPPPQAANALHVSMSAEAPAIISISSVVMVAWRFLQGHRQARSSEQAPDTAQQLST